MSAEIVGSLILKTLGSFAGSILSLVFMLPRSLRDFATRSSGSFISGIVFGPQVSDYLNWSATDDNMVASAALAAFASWWGLGVVVRLVTMFRIAPPAGGAGAKE